MNAATGALAGLVLTLPMAVIAAVAVLRPPFVEPALVEVTTADGTLLNPLGLAVLGAAMLALPLALVAAVWPVWRPGTGRRLVAANLAVAALTLGLMVPTWGALATEIYQCEVAQVPNCD